MANQLSKRIGKIHKARNLGEVYGGTTVENRPNVIEAMQAVDLDWDTLIAPVCLSDKLRTKIPGMYGTYRRKGPSLNIPFGTVRGRYRPMHNRESFSWLDNILAGKLDASIVAGGMINFGKKVWMAVDLGGFEAVKGDEVRNIMVVMNSNDGSTHWSVHLIPLRKASQTMVNFLSTDGFYKIRHTRGADLKLTEVEKIVKSGENLLKDFEKTCKLMARTKLTDEEVDRVILETLCIAEEDFAAWMASREGKQHQWVNQVETIKALMKSGPDYAHGKGTMWQVFTAIQGYFDHIRTVRGSGVNTDNLYESKLVGYSASQKVRAFNVCQHVTTNKH